LLSKAEIIGDEKNEDPQQPNDSECPGEVYRSR
jgi:hypothetical protein